MRLSGSLMRIIHGSLRNHPWLLKYFFTSHQWSHSQNITLISHPWLTYESSMAHLWVIHGSLLSNSCFFLLPLFLYSIWYYKLSTKLMRLTPWSYSNTGEDVLSADVQLCMSTSSYNTAFTVGKLISYYRIRSSPFTNLVQQPSGLW
jgi:hypothetical protein